NFVNLSRSEFVFNFLWIQTPPTSRRLGYCQNPYFLQKGGTPMFPLKYVKVRNYEAGLYFRDGEFQRLLPPGRHWLFHPLDKMRVDVVSQRAPWLVHEKLDVIVKSGALAGRAQVVDLKDYERALVWIEGRFSHILPPGLYAYWTGVKNVRVEIVDAREVRFQHSDFKPIVRSQQAAQVL